MRIRLRSLPPLAPLKAWFEIPSTLLIDINTITNLKREIKRHFGTSDETLRTSRITLELDDFELLDDSSLNVIRENDLLVIKYKPSPLIGKKRKREDEETIQQEPKSPATPSSTPSSSTSSSSSEESSSSDSDSDSSSSTSSSSSSESSSTSNHHQGKPLGPPVLKKVGGVVNVVPNGLKSKPLSRPSGVSPIPPGHGKSSTHQRNLRRRKKRMTMKEQIETGNAATEAPLASSSDTIPPLSAAGSSAPTSLRTYDDALRDSMLKNTKNDNKKRGFKQGMQSLASDHRVFQDDSIPSSSPSKSTPNGTRARLVPPSERTDLPRNIIVTSVDVEDGIWYKETHVNGKKNKAKAKTPDRQDPGMVDGYEAVLHKAVDESDFVPTQRAVQPEPALGKQEWSWDIVDRSWEIYLPLTSIDLLRKGSTLLWKELSLNMETWAPEIMIHAGEILDVLEDKQIKMRTIPRTANEDLELDQGMDGESTEIDQIIIRQLESLGDYRLFA